MQELIQDPKGDIFKERNYQEKQQNWLDFKIMVNKQRLNVKF